MSQPQTEVLGKFYVGFWDLSLRNLPLGSIRHERIAPEAAKNLIDEARSTGRLRCGSHDDLLAPNSEHPLARYKALCKVLRDDHEIAVDVRDFLSKFDGLTTIFPLDCVELGPQDQLLIVDCSFTIDLNELVNFHGKGMVCTAEAAVFHLFRPHFGPLTKVEMTAKDLRDVYDSFSDDR